MLNTKDTGWPWTLWDTSQQTERSSWSLCFRHWHPLEPRLHGTAYRRLCTSRAEGRTSPSDWLAESRHWWFPWRTAAHGKPSRRRSPWPGGCEGTAPGWFGTLSDRHWKTVGVCGTLYFQVISADIIDGLAVHHESAFRVVEGGVCGHCPAGIPIHDPFSMPWPWWYTAPSIVPLMRCSCPVLLAEKYPHSIMFPPPCLTVGMVFLGSWVTYYSHNKFIKNKQTKDKSKLFFF